MLKLLQISPEQRQGLEVLFLAKHAEEWSQPPPAAHPQFGREFYNEFEALSVLRGPARSVEPCASREGGDEGSVCGGWDEARARASALLAAGEEALKQAAVTFAKLVRPCDYLLVDFRVAADGSYRLLEFNATCNLATVMPMNIGAGAAVVSHAAMIEHLLCYSMRRQGVLAA